MVSFRQWMLLTVALVGGAADAQQLRIATLAPEGTGWMREMRAAGEEIEQRTEARVRLQFYPGGVMGNDATVLRRMRAGQLQGGAFTGSELTAVWADGQIYGLPFQFRDQAEVDFVRARLDVQVRAGFRERGLVVAGIAGGGFIYLMGTRPATRVEDLTASKVWVPQGDTISEVTFRTGGVNPVSLSIGDVLTGLQTGLVDVAGNTPAGAVAFQWHTRLRHLVELPVAYMVGYLVFEGRAFGRLAEADQAVVLEVMDAAFQRLNALNHQDNVAALETLRRQGLSFATPSAEETERWRDVGARATEQLIDQGTVSRAMHQELTALLREYRAE